MKKALKVVAWIVAFFIWAAAFERYGIQAAILGAVFGVWYFIDARLTNIERLVSSTHRGVNAVRFGPDHSEG